MRFVLNLVGSKINSRSERFVGSEKKGEVYRRNAPKMRNGEKRGKISIRNRRTKKIDGVQESEESELKSTK